MDFNQSTNIVLGLSHKVASIDNPLGYVFDKYAWGGGLFASPR